MPVIIDYTTLVQAIKDEAEDDGVEFASFIPTAIDQAEDILFKTIDLPELEIEATGSLSPANPVLAKPTGYVFADYFQVRSGSTSRILEKKTMSYIRDYNPSDLNLDFPKYYADRSETQFHLAPSPQSAYTYEIRYTKKPTKLGLTNATNYLTDKCSTPLFYACMMGMSTFMKSWDQIDIWKKFYTDSTDLWNIEAARYRRDGGAVPMAPSVGPNSLKHTVSNTRA